jgi:2-oxoglutarate dehydrogenase E1 component
MDKFSYISNADVGYLDQLYQNYKSDPASVDATWQKFFEGYDFSQQRYGENGGASANDSVSIKETQVRNLIFSISVLWPFEIQNESGSGKKKS